jgi:hypothetical protein
MGMVGKTLALRVDVWVDERRQIHLAWDGPAGHSWVTDNPTSERRHPNLYGKLRRALVEAGKWMDEK